MHTNLLPHASFRHCFLHSFQLTQHLLLALSRKPPELWDVFNTWKHEALNLMGIRVPKISHKHANLIT